LGCVIFPRQYGFGRPAKIGVEREKWIADAERFCFGKTSLLPVFGFTFLEYGLFSFSGTGSLDR